MSNVDTNLHSKATMSITNIKFDFQWKLIENHFIKKKKKTDFNKILAIVKFTLDSSKIMSKQF